MSYSINVRAKSKQEAKERAQALITQQVACQKSHADSDLATVRTTCDGMIDACKEPDATQDVVLEAHGSVSGHWDGAGLVEVRYAQINAKAYLAPKLHAA